MEKEKSVGWGKVNFVPHADDDDFIAKPASCMRQKTLSPRERLLPPDSPLKKTKKRVHSKVSPPDMKQYPSKKKRSISTQTCAYEVSTSPQMNTPPIDEFPVGSIVGINEYDLDYGKSKIKKNHLCFTELS